MLAALRPAEETARLGKEIYHRDIRQHVEDAHHGDIVAVDVDNGHWAIADNETNASRELRTHHPNVINVYFLRVGYRVAVSIGGGPLPREA